MNPERSLEAKIESRENSHIVDIEVRLPNRRMKLECDGRYLVEEEVELEDLAVWLDRDSRTVIKVIESLGIQGGLMKKLG
ncbi:MAG: hypothetical protein ACOX0Z_04045 [Candidatus Nanosyncoccaceae bacterium]